MKLRKPDEMEKSHNLKSARNAFMFYTAALLIWAFYDFITTGDYGWQMTILLVGTAIFWWSRTILYKKTETEEETSNANKSNTMDNILCDYFSSHHWRG